MTLLRPLLAWRAGPRLVRTGAVGAALATLTLLGGCASPAPSESPSSRTPILAPDTPVPTPDEAGGALPPDALLQVEGGDPVVAQLGTFTWLDGGSASPWLPGAPIKAAAGETLTVSLRPDGAVVGWTAVIATYGADGAGDRPLGGGTTAIRLVAPAPGMWTIAITIDFGAPGRATYFWLLEVS